MAEQRSNIAAVAGARDKNSSSLVGTRPSTQSSKKKTKQMAKGTDLKSKEEEYRLVWFVMQCCRLIYSRTV